MPHDPTPCIASPIRLDRRRAFAAAVAAALLAATAVLWLWSALLAIRHFALRFPAFDQYRLYPNYLRLPFPANVLQSENLHHPVLPNLVRLADLGGSHASQRIQIGAGIGAALAILALLVAVVLGQRELSWPRRAAACLAATLALFWLGNARTLIHGFEAVHVYFALLGALLAALALARARRDDRLRWSALASLACVAATFSYGAGMASFAMAIVLAAVVGLRPRHGLLTGAVGVLCLGVYLFALPGDGGVRESLHLDPLGSLAAMTSWLASPWLHAGLGCADAAFDPALQRTLAASAGGRAVLALATTLAAPFGPTPLPGESRCIGALGLLAYATILIDAWRRGESLGRLRFVALGVASFAAATAAIVCIGRLEYFAELPAQLFADRYSPWPCAFWLGLALYALGSRPRSRAAGAATIAAVALAVPLLWPAHATMAGWAAAVHRNLSQSAVAIQLGVWDPERIFDVYPDRPAETLDTIALWRSHGLAMFADPAYAWLRAAEPLPAADPPPLAHAVARVVRRFDDPIAQRPVAAFEGWLPPVDPMPREPILAVVDAAGRVRGLARTSFFGPGVDALRLWPTRMLGFDGYVLDPQAGERLQIRVLSRDGHDQVAVIPLPWPAPPAAPPPQ